MNVCQKLDEKNWSLTVTRIVKILVLILGMWLADSLRTDYGGYGVLCIAVLYFFRKNKEVQLIAGSVAFVVGDMLIHGGNSELFDFAMYTRLTFYCS
jgi:hypothetical protein